MQGRLKIYRQLNPNFLYVLSHYILIVRKICFLSFRKIANLAVVQVTSKHPKLIFYPLASKIIVKQQKPLDPIDLIEKQCKSCFSVGLYFRGGGVGFSFIFLTEFLDLLVESFDFLLYHVDLFLGVFGYFGGFGRLQGFEYFSQFEVHGYVIKIQS